ncbi:MAG: hypothetical protein C0410_02670 [Anaerolinea sp.]|nr:hypothetical protein [Anaerolinea sp.]
MQVMVIKPRVLFATPVLHHPPVGGPTLRIENSIKALAQISDLYIYNRVSPDKQGGTEDLAFYEQYCKGFFFAPFVPTSRYTRFLSRAINAISKRTLGWHVIKSGWEPMTEDFGHLLTIASDVHADVIWLGYGNISYPLLKYIKDHTDYKVVVDTDSVWSRFVLRGLPFARSGLERRRIKKSGKDKEDEERWGTQLADVTTAVSKVDAEYYCSLAKDSRQIHIFSNVIDIALYQQVPPPADNLKSPCMYLAGTFTPGNAMDDAARWVIGCVLPIVRQQIPDVHLYCVGTGSNQILSDIRDPGITITGQLTTVLPYLCYADVALVPLRFESGTRFKILEAGACGIPVVSTTLGAEGISVAHEKNILIADEPESFARSIVRILQDRKFALALAENLKMLVYEKCNIATLAQEGSPILRYLIGDYIPVSIVRKYHEQ